MLTTALSFFLLTTFSMLVFSIKRNLLYIEKIDELSEKIQYSIDVLEEQYRNIEKKSKIEIFSDEPVVRELIVDMANAKNSILVIAKLLDDSIEIEEIQKDRMT